MVPVNNNFNAASGWNSAYQKEQPTQGIFTAFINGGDNAAMNYPVPNGRAVVLIDSTAGFLWLRATDAYGLPAKTKKYKLTEVETQATGPVTRNEFNALSQQIQQLQQLLLNAQNNGNSAAKVSNNAKGGAK